MKYIVEEIEGTWNIFEINEQDNKKKLIAVFFVDTHARITCRLMNEYINNLSWR
jgi:hypothetical protein